MGKQLKAESGDAMGCACSAVGANLWRGGMKRLAGRVRNWKIGEIGEDTGEPLEGRIKQDSIINPVIVPVFHETEVTS
jgi:hypothetical protein